MRTELLITNNNIVSYARLKVTRLFGHTAQLEKKLCGKSKYRKQQGEGLSSQLQYVHEALTHFILLGHIIDDLDCYLPHRVRKGWVSMTQTWLHPPACPTNNSKE